MSCALTGVIPNLKNSRYIVKSKEDILEADYIKQVSSILWADALTSPLAVLLDPMGKINHYIFARMAKNQQHMNSYFMGTKWFLAERYAALCKSFFVTLFFSSLLPQGYYITAAGFIVNYWVRMRTDLIVHQLWRMYHHNHLSV